ncbi:MAG: hypothetical protein ACLUEV_02400 [Alistipes sp.]
MNTNLKTVLETAIGDPITSAVSGTGKIRTKSGAEYFLKSGAPSESYVCEAEGLKNCRKPESSAPRKSCPSERITC